MKIIPNFNKAVVFILRSLCILYLLCTLHCEPRVYQGPLGIYYSAPRSIDIRGWPFCMLGLKGLIESWLHVVSSPLCG